MIGNRNKQNVDETSNLWKAAERDIGEWHRAENVFVGSRRKLTRSGPNPVRMSALKAISGLDLSLRLYRASRVEPRILRPMHYMCSAWDFLMKAPDSG